MHKQCPFVTGFASYIAKAFLFFKITLEKILEEQKIHFLKLIMYAEIKFLKQPKY